MKAIKQRFHKEIVRKYKENYFATIRKELLEQQEFQVFYQRILESGGDLIALVDKWGYVVFFKHVRQIIDQRLYQKLYHHDEKYFLHNLNFVNYLLQLEVLPIEHIEILVCGLTQVLAQHQRISALNVSEIFQIVEKILLTQKYISNSLEPIMKYSLFPKLYDIIIHKEVNQYFFKLVQFFKIVGDDHVEQISDQQKLHCLQIHILTSSSVEELYVSYSILGDIFQKTYTNEQELYEYGSILDKIMKDIVIDRLIEPISYFLIKAFNNQSLKKLSVQMGYIDTIFDVVLNHLMVKNNISIFGHQSIWSIFGKIITTLAQNNKAKLIENLDWRGLKEKLNSYHGMKYPYLKIEVDETLEGITKAKSKNAMNLVPFQCEHIVQKLEDVQI